MRGGGCMNCTQPRRPRSPQWVGWSGVGVCERVGGWGSFRESPALTENTHSCSRIRGILCNVAWCYTWTHCQLRPPSALHLVHRAPVPCDFFLIGKGWTRPARQLMFFEKKKVSHFVLSNKRFMSVLQIWTRVCLRDNHSPLFVHYSTFRAARATPYCISCRKGQVHLLTLNWCICVQSMCLSSLCVLA